MGENMPGLYGADVVELHSLSRKLQAASARLTSTRSLLGQELASSFWKGSDAARFRNDWNSTHSALLLKVATALSEAGHALASQAREQEQASASGGWSTTATAASPAVARTAGGFFDGTDHSIARHPERGVPDLTTGELERLKGLVRDAGANNDFFEGNDRDLGELRDALAGLTPAQLDQLLRELPDEDLRRLAEGAASDGKGIFNWEGTTPFERHGVLDQLLSKASTEQVDRLRNLIPWAQPNGASAGDSARPGGAETSASNAWKNPDAPVVGRYPSKDDIRQGGYGDCVVLSAAGAMINAQPGWAQEHVTDNGNGTVSVKLFDSHGQEQWVTVTKDLPVKEDGDPKGARPGPGGNWPAYIEKAMAQVYSEDDNRDGTPPGTPPDIEYGPGSYRAIEGNYGPDAFRYLAGPDVDQTDDADAVWDAAREGRPALVTTLGRVPEGAPEGYFAGHAYFVTGMDKGGNLLLQNPWGSQYPVLTVTPQEFEDDYGNASVVR
jgi:hypothetical protein